VRQNKLRIVLERTPKREANRLRQRRLRAQRRAGLVPYRLVLPEVTVIDALIDARRLSEEEALHPELVETELARVLIEWAARWPPA
jgi:hypothetical protein